MKFEHLLSLNGSQIRLHKEWRQVSTTTSNMTAQEVSLNYPQQSIVESRHGVYPYTKAARVPSHVSAACCQMSQRPAVTCPRGVLKTYRYRLDFEACWGYSRTSCAHLVAILVPSISRLRPPETLKLFLSKMHVGFPLKPNRFHYTGRDT